MVRWNVTSLTEDEINDEALEVIKKLESSKLEYRILDIWTNCKLVFLIDCKNTIHEIAEALQMNEKELHRKDSMVIFEY